MRRFFEYDFNRLDIGLESDFFSSSINVSSVAFILRDVSIAPLLDGPLFANIDGTPGDDTLNGTADADVINGFAGDDVINGLGGDDIICGGAGNDRILGDSGDDIIVGGPGFDHLEGNACLLYTSPSPRDKRQSRMPSSA